MVHTYSCDRVHILVQTSCGTSLLCAERVLSAFRRSGQRQENQFTRGSKRLGVLIPLSAERAIIFHLLLHSLNEPKESLSMYPVDGLGDVTIVKQRLAASSPGRLPPDARSRLPGPLPGAGSH